MQAPAIVLTVPHARCPSPEYAHECDYAALPTARMLHQYLSSAWGGRVRSILSLPAADEFRRDCDLNRDVCEESPYRKRVRQLLTGGAGNLGIVLDIHSFPQRYTSFGPVDVALLDDEMPHADYTYSLQEYLKAKAGVRAGIIHGMDNSIMEEARQRGHRAVLVEFNERFLNPVYAQEWQGVVQAVADWAVSLVT